MHSRISPNQKISGCHFGRQAYTAAVIQFSGWASADKADENWQQLRRFLIAEGIDIIGEPTLNQYNPPWTLPFMRRNEIIVPVAFPLTAMN